MGSIEEFTKKINSIMEKWEHLLKDQGLGGYDGAPESSHKFA